MFGGVEWKEGKNGWHNGEGHSRGFPYARKHIPESKDTPFLATWNGDATQGVRAQRMEVYEEGKSTGNKHER